jgi:hypothetical protein
MKEELRSDSQTEMGGAGLPAVADLSAKTAAATADAAKVGKSGKTHFSAKIIFLPSFRPASNQKVQSNCVNPMLLVKMQANRMQLLCDQRFAGMSRE